MCDDACPTPDAEVSATPGATTEHSDAPTAIEQSVIDLLRRSELARVDFVVAGPTHVSAAEFRARACEIERHLLHVVEVERPPVGDACYQSVDRAHRRATRDTAEVTALAANTLYVKDAEFDLERPLTRALVLHEMVHATQDAAGTPDAEHPMDVFHAEVAAYTLQAMVFILFGSTWSAQVSANRPAMDSTLSEEAAATETARRAAMDRLVAESEAAANELLAASAGAEMSAARVESMIAAIGGIAYYATHGGDDTHFDGITAPTTAVGRRRRR